MGNGPLRETTHREGKAMRIARLILLALALTFVGSVVVSTGSMARSTNGCDTQDNEGSDHGNGHDAFCDGEGFP